MVKQIRILWSASGGGGGQTALHFSDGATPADINTTVQAFGTAVRGFLANTTSFVVEQVVRSYDTTTGQLLAETPAVMNANIVGNGGLNAVPNASQGLIKLGTTLIVGGRALRGRIYIPGAATGMVAANGEVTPAALTILNAAAATLVGGTATAVVWHRPKNGVGGNSSLVSSTSAWSEWAVQRRRRS